MTYTSFVEALRKKGAIETRINSFYFNAILAPGGDSFYYSWTDTKSKIGTTELLSNPINKIPNKDTTLSYLISMYDG